MIIFQNLSIKVKFAVIGIVFSFAAIVSVYGTIKLSKLLHLTRLERDHTILVGFVENQVYRLGIIFREEGTNNEKQIQKILNREADDPKQRGLVPLLKDMQSKPVIAMRNTTWMETMLFRILGYSDALELAKQEITNIDIALRIIRSYSRNNISQTEFEKRIREQLDVIFANGTNFAGLMDEFSTALRNTIITLTSLIMFIALVFQFLLARSMVKPLHILSAQARRIAGGDLTRRVKLEQYDEMGQMNEAINQIIKRIGENINTVKDASQRLADGANSQASATEETSSSLEEIASMTRQNADYARQADEITQNAVSSMKEANSSMEGLTHSMEALSSMSDEIKKIIKTIDEIAFQTNLLSLNAAVEAARAGETGAGFAVVAEEVRSLAMRSASAAKNTADLIENTVRKIGESTETVSKTAKIFTDVSESAKKVGELVSEIAHASKEQSQGIEQVNQTMIDIDRVVQENAAYAQELNQSVKVFQTDEKESGNSGKALEPENHGKEQKKEVFQLGREKEATQIIPLDDKEDWSDF